MKFKTKIEIIAEAKDKNEAAELAGEYLSGNIFSGVDMKCTTRPVYNGLRNAAIALSVVSLITILAVSSLNISHCQGFGSNLSGISAVQAPLRTSPADRIDANFKKEWQDKQIKSALDQIKK